MRRLTRAAAAAAMALLTVLAACDDDRPAAGADAQLMPPGPLGARERMTAAWAGSQLYVLGGARGAKDRVSNVGGGASFDPATGRWQSLPADAMTKRRGAGAVARADEVLVWGGELSCGSDACLSERTGAVLDTTRRTWRAFDPGPAVRGMSDPQLVTACRQVFAAGGGSGQGEVRESRVVLGSWAGTGWRTVPLGAVAYDLVATSDRVYVATVDARQHVAVEVLDACTGEVLRTVPASDRRAVRGLWLELVGDQLVLARSIGDQAVVQVLSAQDVWSTLTTVALDDMPMPQTTDGYSKGWSGVAGRTVYGVTGLGLWTLDTRTKRVGRIPTTARTCAAGAVAALSPRQLLVWGGQPCTAQGADQSATGLMVPLAR